MKNDYRPLPPHDYRPLPPNDYSPMKNDVCDKHGKGDCEECFYATAPELPRDGKRIVTLLNHALEGEKLSERGWKRIARLNAILLE